MGRLHRIGLLFDWHITEKVWVQLNTQTMEVTVQQGFEGEKVVLQPEEWFKMMVSIDREMGKQRVKVAHMIVAAGARFVSEKPQGSVWGRIWQKLRPGSSASSVT